MMKVCQDRSKYLDKHAILADSYNFSVGTEVSYRCACANKRLRGWLKVTCTADGLWEPSELPACENDWLAPFSPREYTMLGIAALCLFTLIVLVMSLIIRQHRKNKRSMKSSQRLNDRLKSLKANDPLDQIIQREVTRRESGEFRRRSLRESKAASERAKGGRQSFRVWNQDGSERHKLMAWSLDDLMNQACEKLHLTSPLSIVLELDGKRIRSTEELFNHNGKLLVALEAGQEWRPIRGQHNALDGHFYGSPSIRRSQSDDSYLNCSTPNAARSPRAVNDIDGSAPEIARSPSHEGLETPDDDSDFNSGQTSPCMPSMTVYSIQAPGSGEVPTSEEESLPAVALMDET